MNQLTPEHLSMEEAYKQAPSERRGGFVSNKPVSPSQSYYAIYLIDGNAHSPKGRLSNQDIKIIQENVNASSPAADNYTSPLGGQQMV